MKKDGTQTEPKESRRKINIRQILVVGLCILIVFSVFFIPIFFFFMFVNVDVGYAALIVDPIANTISQPILGPTFIVKAPWVGVALVFYATDTYDAIIPCFSSDQLEMQIEVMMRWQLGIDKVRQLYISYPRLNYETEGIDSIMSETIRLVTKNFTALETIESRDQVASEMENTVFQKLKDTPSLGDSLTHLEFDLKNIAYPANYTSAIEDKLAAQQKQLQASYDRERILILANATAQEAIIQAEGEMQAKIIVANGTKEAIEMILAANGGNVSNSTRIAELYLWIEALKQIAPEVHTLILATPDQSTLIQIPTNP